MARVIALVQVEFADGLAVQGRRNFSGAAPSYSIG